MSDRPIRECEYPPCHEPGHRRRYYKLEPEPIGVLLCEYHGEILHRNMPGEEEAFWQWALAMLDMRGHG
jgi:hypothetical protein